MQTLLLTSIIYPSTIQFLTANIKIGPMSIDLSNHSSLFGSLLAFLDDRLKPLKNTTVLVYKHGNSVINTTRIYTNLLM